MSSQLQIDFNRERLENEVQQFDSIIQTYIKNGWEAPTVRGSRCRIIGKEKNILSALFLKPGLQFHVSVCRDESGIFDVSFYELLPKITQVRFRAGRQVEKEIEPMQYIRIGHLNFEEVCDFSAYSINK